MLFHWRNSIGTPECNNASTTVPLTKTAIFIEFYQLFIEATGVWEAAQITLPTLSGRKGVGNVTQSGTVDQKCWEFYAIIPG